jgi:hypothetical protein
MIFVHGVRPAISTVLRMLYPTSREVSWVVDIAGSIQTSAWAAAPALSSASPVLLACNEYRLFLSYNATRFLQQVNSDRREKVGKKKKEMCNERISSQ